MDSLQFRFLGPLNVRCGGRQLLEPSTLRFQSLLVPWISTRPCLLPRSRPIERFRADGPERIAGGYRSTALRKILLCCLKGDLILRDLQASSIRLEADAWPEVELFCSQTRRGNTANPKPAAVRL